MPIRIRHLHPLFVGEILDMNLAAPLGDPIIREIAVAADRYAVLVIRGQALTDELQIAFGKRFGELEDHTSRYRKEDRPRLRREMTDISNLDSDNRTRTRDDRRRLRSLGNRLWHTDSSFMPIPAALSMLYAHATPPSGGETEFADLRAAYDDLPEETKLQIEDLVAEHWYLHSREKLGFTDFSPEERAAMPPVHQRLVRFHPGSRRKTLYLAAHATHIVGWPVPEGRMLLHDLMEFATQRRYVYRHEWRNGDLVIWDNRCTMHRGRAFDESYPRDMRRVTTVDVASTLDQPLSLAAE